MQYQICPHCGVHLDFGERCDCKKSRPGTAIPKAARKNIQQYCIVRGRKSQVKTEKMVSGSIHLQTLILDNFKCLKHFELNLFGADGIIYAANGAGKTSLADAYFWLLTGKDSAGGVPGEKLFPVDAPTEVGASVAGHFTDGDGQTFSLCRVLKRKIQRSRGEAEATIRGTSTEYSINGVVKPQKEYISFVQERFGDETALRMLSDHSFFAQALHWEERRELLIKSFAPHMTDLDVVNAHPQELSALSNYIGAMHTVRELEEKKLQERRKLRKKLEEIPSRIDELERARPQLPEGDTGAQMPSLAKRRANLLYELEDLQGGGAVAQAEAESAACLERLSRAKSDYLAQNRVGNGDLERQCAELRREIQNVQAEEARCQGVIKSAKASLEVADQELARLRQEAKEIHYRAFPADAAACPTCGQPLPPDKLAEQQARFNEKKAKAIEENRARGLSCVQDRRNFEDILKENEEKAVRQKARLGDLQNQLAAVQCSIVEPALFEETSICKKLTAQLEAAKKACAELRERMQPQIEAKKQELAQVDVDIDAAKDRAALAGLAGQVENRIRELQDEEKRLGVELAKTEGLLAAAERFVELQAQDIEGKVNEAFSLVRWQLFEKQVNGGTAPCCKATVGGVAWESGINALNTAAQVNAGLDIINTLARAQGKSFPVWLDNAESVTDCLSTEGQCIRLYVHAGDEGLRVDTIENQEKEST